MQQQHYTQNKKDNAKIDFILFQIPTILKMMFVCNVRALKLQE
ncbi:uncharacterized protein METZ01_LOCUS69220 [marine metagenome]|uniref:Uncharacterized protein n=1 Tax=marine metagenome TaxID=408172 RepID=A0A381TJU9_9ZZZZ